MGAPSAGDSGGRVGVSSDRLGRHTGQTSKRTSESHRVAEGHANKTRLLAGALQSIYARVNPVNPCSRAGRSRLRLASAATGAAPLPATAAVANKIVFTFPPPESENA